MPIDAQAPLDDISCCLMTFSFVCRWNVGCKGRCFRHGQCKLPHMKVLVIVRIGQSSHLVIIQRRESHPSISLKFLELEVFSFEFFAFYMSSSFDEKQFKI